MKFPNRCGTLSRDEQIVLATAYLKKAICNSRMQPLLEMNSIEIGKIISSLVNKNMIVTTNKGRWTTYSVNEKYVSSSDIQGDEIPRSRIIKEITPQVPLKLPPKLPLKLKDY